MSAPPRFALTAWWEIIYNPKSIRYFIVLYEGKPHSYPVLPSEHTNMTRAVSFSLVSLLVMLSLGCHRAKRQDSARSSVAATEMTRRMVGEWGADSEVALIIALDGDRIVVSTPENDTWRMDILDAQIVDYSIHFIQKNYLHDGESHPFNGVACNSIAKIIDDDTLEFGATTVHTPKYESYLLTRIK